MTYKITRNEGPPEALDGYARLADDAKVEVRRAHTAIFRYATENRPPFSFTGVLVESGMIFDDPMPKPDYVNGLIGAWIWSSPSCYFRFRIIATKSKLDTWEYGVGPRPQGILLTTIQPSGKLSFRGG